MSRNRWRRDSDAPEGDRNQVVFYGPKVAVRCPCCGSSVELGAWASTGPNDSGIDQCSECGVQVRVTVEWREAVRA